MPSRPRSRGSWRVVSPVVFAACGLLLITSARAADGVDLRTGDTGDLADLVRVQEQRVAELENQADDLAGTVDDLTEQVSGDVDGATGDRIEQLRPSAGHTAVRGPGVTVTLDDAPLPADRSVPTGGDIEDYIVHQQDLESVMNALWSGGAEAMMVMDQRVVSTSFVRCVGPVLRVEGRTYSPPYTISVIGDVDRLQEALDNAPDVADYRQWADRIGLGYDVTVHDTLDVPAHEGTLDAGRDDIP